MALGKSGIAAAREELNTIGSKVAEARVTNDSFIKLYSDVNFQKFVSETDRGSLINEQLQNLAKWTASMCDTVDNMRKNSEKYLDQQEALNR